MAAEISPSLTSTSHTLTSAPASKMMPTTTRSLPDDGGRVPATAAVGLLERFCPDKRYEVMRPSRRMADDALQVVKETLDAFAAQVGEQQERRLKESRKRKRAGEHAIEVLKLRKLHVDGFETGQVWQQAKKIIGSVLEFSDVVLGELEEKREVAFETKDGSRTLTNGRDGLGILSTGKDVDSADRQDSSSIMHEQSPSSDENEAEEEGLDADLNDSDEGDDVTDAQDDGDDQHNGFDDADIDDDARLQEYTQDPHGLNDGFFSIDQFNRLTQLLEEQDARGDAAMNEAASDEEDIIDWGADPFVAGKKADEAPKRARKQGKKRQGRKNPGQEDSDEDDGPTFGDMPLDAPEGASDEEAISDDEEDGGAELNANEIYYKDFFAPPPRKYKANKRTNSVKFEVQEPDEADVERAMTDVRRDLFDASEDESSVDGLVEASTADGEPRQSAHERRQAKLVTEILKLEAASVAKREWTLMGEAPAAERPVNSLLEEDLDFEHMGKPVPVITPEVSESIEALIKRRILAREFDEVLRRRPDADSIPTGTRRGLAELDDGKPSKSLAEIYEEEHVQRTNPESHISQSEEKLRRDEAEVEAMWKEVCARLDALSSWHYKPKPPAPALFIVADVATVAMEDAQPGTATVQGLAASASRLAPQEIYRAGEGEAQGDELVTRGGLPVARRELTREERTRRRRRNKERARKTDTGSGTGAGRRVGPETKGAKGRRETLAALKKGGVKVINRRGEITDVEGNKKRAAKGVTSGSLKL